MSKNDRPSTIASYLKACPHDMYPNLHVLLRICGTIPVTSCECERSGSVLKRLHTYLRASMGQTRLSALALLSMFKYVWPLLPPGIKELSACSVFFSIDDF